MFFFINFRDDNFLKNFFVFLQEQLVLKIPSIPDFSIGVVINISPLSKKIFVIAPSTSNCPFHQGICLQKIHPPTRNLARTESSLFKCFNPNNRLCEYSLVLQNLVFLHLLHKERD